MRLSPSSSLRSPANSADSEREANDVRLEEPDEAWLGGRLPISRLIQCSHKEELVDPNVPNRQRLKTYSMQNIYIRDCTLYELISTEITSHRTVGRPRWNCGTSLIKQDITSLLADFIFRHRMNIAIIKAIPLSINGVLTVS